MFIPRGTCLHGKPNKSNKSNQGTTPQSGGTLGSAMTEAAKKLRRLRDEIDKPVAENSGGAKLYDCPGCGEHTCYWIGGGPHDIECLNRQCKFFEEPPPEGTKRITTSFEVPFEETARKEKAEREAAEKAKKQADDTGFDEDISWGFGD